MKNKAKRNQQKTNIKMKIEYTYQIWLKLLINIILVYNLYIKNPLE